MGWALLFTVLLATAGTLLAVLVAQRPVHQAGQVVERPIVPRVEFYVVDEAATMAARDDAYQRTPPIYVVRQDYLRKLRERLDSLLAIGADPSVTEIEQLDPETVARFDLNARSLRELQRLSGSEEERTWWQERTEHLVTRLASIAMLDAGRAAAEKDERERAPGITIRQPVGQGGEVLELPRQDAFLYSIETDLPVLRSRVQLFVAQLEFPVAVRPSVIAAVMHEPEVIYELDMQATDQRRSAAAAAEPEVTLYYGPDTVMVRAGDRLAEHDVDLLRQERRAYLAHLASQGPMSRWLFVAGQFGSIVMLGGMLWLYVLAWNRRVAENPMRGLAVIALFIMAVTLAVMGTLYQPQLIFFTAVFPTLLVTFVLAIAYDQRFAVAMGCIHALLAMIVLQGGPALLLVTLTGVGLTAGQLDEVRTRSKLVAVGFWTGLGMGLAATVLTLATRDLTLPGVLSRVLFDAILVGVTGLLAGIIVQGVLPVVETAFRVTTAMTLKELNDASHPLLRRMAQEAPGTYQHSLNLSHMSEAAADAIGGNGLLCKVGAMYHDIGKINKPNYFVENQGGGPNRHNRLPPSMSLLIIVGHVKDGIEMARDYRLPMVLRHFIESHHGTTLVEFFFHAAQQKRDAENQPAPQDFEFRYPGPKPRTREAAILMLCDGIEGAARALPEPTPVRLEQLVHRMAQKRLMDGQFDDCNLTLSELHQIERAISKTLAAIYHGRIKYPGDNRPAQAGRSAPPVPPSPADPNIDRELDAGADGQPTAQPA